MGDVNVTVVLPITGTPVDHYTVFYGKTGKETADKTSMLKAIDLVIQLVNNRRIVMEDLYGKR